MYLSLDLEASIAFSLFYLGYRWFCLIVYTLFGIHPTLSAGQVRAALFRVLSPISSSYILIACKRYCKRHTWLAT